MSTGRWFFIAQPCCCFFFCSTENLLGWFAVKGLLSVTDKKCRGPNMFAPSDCKGISDFWLTASTPLHTSVTWFEYFLSLRYLRCKWSADKWNGMKTHFQKIIYRLDILFKMNPLITNLMWYDCDISSRASIIFHKKGPRKGGEGGEVTKGGRGGVKVKILDNVLSTFTVYILMYKYNNSCKYI